jgi:hypothetical protein
MGKLLVSYSIIENRPQQICTTGGGAMAEITQEQAQLREKYLIALAEATFPLKKEAADLEVTLELLIDAAGMLREHLLKELAEVRTEQD